MSQGYQMGNGQWADTVDCTLLQSATKTATFNTDAIELGDCASARLDLAVTAASGTLPTLDVEIQTSPDGSTWTAVASFTQKTTTGSQHKLFAPLDRYVRAACTIGGTTPSFTFSLSGEAC